MAANSKTCENVILEFCKAREELSVEKRATKDERAEQLDAERTLNGLLIESMKRNGVTCICMGDEVGEKKYLKALPPTKRSVKIKTVDDILELTKDMSRYVETIPKPELAAAVVNVFKKRALDKGEVGSSRLVLTQKGTRGNITERTMLTGETLSLSCQYIEAKTELMSARDKITKLKNKKVDAEKRLIPLLPSEGVLVKVSGGEGRKEKTIRIQSSATSRSSAPEAAPPGLPSKDSPGDATLPPAPSPHPPGDATLSSPPPSSPPLPGDATLSSPPPPPTRPLLKLGMREAISIVREAATEASEVRHTPDMDFDEALKVCIVRRISSYTPKETPKRTTIKTSRAVFTEKR